MEDQQLFNWIMQLDDREDYVHQEIQRIGVCLSMVNELRPKWFVPLIHQHRFKKELILLKWLDDKFRRGVPSWMIHLDYALFQFGPIKACLFLVTLIMMLVAICNMC